MFTLEIDEHSCTFTAEQTKALLDGRLAKAKAGPHHVLCLLRGRPPRRPPKRVAAKHSRLGFAIDGKTHWISQKCFAEFEQVAQDAADGQDTYFGMGLSRRGGRLASIEYTLLEIDSGEPERE
jgi:hypothetical protein